MVTLLVILFLTDVVLGFFVWNLLRKLEAVEDSLDELEKEYTQADTILDSMQERIQNAMDKMKSIDRIGSFEADDETGYVFREMYSIIEELDGYYGKKSEITKEQ
jgi:exonuclease VII small subunit